MLPVFAILFAFFPVRAAPCQCKPASLCLPLDIPPRKEIFAFYVPSSGPWNQLNWTELTTVVIFGSVDPNIVCYAHERRVRVVTGEDFDHSQLGNATARQEWVTSKIQSTRDAGLDGINFDIEGNAANRDGLTALVSLSYNRFKSELPGSQVTFDTSIDASANSPGEQVKSTQVTITRHLQTTLTSSFPWATTCVGVLKQGNRTHHWRVWSTVFRLTINWEYGRKALFSVCPGTDTISPAKILPEQVPLARSRLLLAVGRGKSASTKSKISSKQMPLPHSTKHQKVTLCTLITRAQLTRKHTKCGLTTRPP
eukprot:TRINITY_DN3960_c0_g1_i2.p1 TRINITY_DN3960_c0_g1~~TRINITY_DN3960_c0_g1_i2.p1  ORF type:complete len:311 (-),score=16.86 TRINITY_DN3960_c0_g1_i2:117-1049(-)